MSKSGAEAGLTSLRRAEELISDARIDIARESALNNRLGQFRDAANSPTLAPIVLNASPGFGDYDLSDYRNFEIGD